MNKGMFYLLPFLALTPVVASNALPKVEVAHLLNVLDQVKTADASKATLMSPKPISGRNIDRRRFKVAKPVAGRNRKASRLRKQATDRVLIRRR